MTLAVLNKWLAGLQSSQRVAMEA